MAKSGSLSIVHPTSFSSAGQDAFIHALRIALAARCELHLLPLDQGPSFDPFPYVRAHLVAWGLMKESEFRADAERRFGFRIGPCDLFDGPSPATMLAFIEKLAGELLILGAEGPAGWSRLREGSMNANSSQKVGKSTLFMTPRSRGFVDPSNGDLILNRVLMPIDHHTPHARALDRASDLLNLLNPDGVEIYLLHVGKDLPAVRPSKPIAGKIRVELRSGPVAPAILAAADDLGVDLVAMPTAGNYGVLDALRGSVTERILHLAPVPVLAIPAR